MQICQRVFEWSIPEDYLTPTKLLSPFFRVEKALADGWCLQCWPNGNTADAVGFVSLFLESTTADDKDPGPEVQFTLSIVDSAMPQRTFSKGATHTFTSKYCDWGFARFMPAQEMMNNYVQGGHLVIRAEIDIIQQPSALYVPQSLLTCPDPAARAFERHFNNPQFSDVRVVCEDGSSLACHRLVLASVSRPMEAMLTAGMQEAQQAAIHIRQVESATVCLFMEWVYGRKVQVPADQLLSLWSLAHQYDVQDLAEQCEAELKLRCSSRKLHLDLHKMQASLLRQAIVLLPDKDPLRATIFAWVVKHMQEWSAEDFLRLSRQEVLPLVSACRSLPSDASAQSNVSLDEPVSADSLILDSGSISLDHMVVSSNRVMYEGSYYVFLCPLLTWTQQQPQELRAKCLEDLLSAFPLRLLSFAELHALRRHPVAALCPKVDSFLTDAYEVKCRSTKDLMDSEVPPACDPMAA